MNHPTFVRIDHWIPADRDWWTAHAGINLLKPDVYVQKLAQRGVIARAVDVETGEMVYGNDGGDLL